MRNGATHARAESQRLSRRTTLETPKIHKMANHAPKAHHANFNSRPDGVGSYKNSFIKPHRSWGSSLRLVAILGAIILGWIVFGYGGILHTRVKYVSNLSNLQQCMPTDPDYCACALMRSSQRGVIRSQAQRDSQWIVRSMSKALERGSRDPMYYIRKYERHYGCSIDDDADCALQVCGEVDRKAGSHRSAIDLAIGTFASIFHSRRI